MECVTESQTDLGGGRGRRAKECSVKPLKNGRFGCDQLVPGTISAPDAKRPANALGPLWSKEATELGQPSWLEAKCGLSKAPSSPEGSFR